MKAILLALFASASIAGAGIITQNFTNNPLADGWKVFGDTNLFAWDATNHNLAVTWDSSHSNSYFYHSLGTILGRDDDFQASFDLQFNDIAAGVNTNKPDAIEVAVGFMNIGNATGDFVRGTPAFPLASPDPKNLAEFDYFPAFVDPFAGPIDASVAPTLVSSNFAFDGAFGDFFLMTNGVSYNIQMNYTSSNQTLLTTVTLSGQSDVLITASATVTRTNDFRVDTFSISSYTDIGDDFDSLLAHGVVGNVIVTTPPPPVMNVSGAFTNNVWQVQLTSRSNWVYTLEHTADFQSWAAASAAVPGNGTTLTLQDTNDATMKSFYRVRAQKP